MTIKNEEYVEGLRAFCGEAKAFTEKLRKATDGCLSSWSIEQLLTSYASMFNRFCPYQVGDRVELVADEKVTPGSGWWASRHYLNAGSSGEVRERGYSDGRFEFSVMFDRESWISETDKKERRVSSRHIYCIFEKNLTRTEKPYIDPFCPHTFSESPAKPDPQTCKLLSGHDEPHDFRGW